MRSGRPSVLLVLATVAWSGCAIEEVRRNAIPLPGGDPRDAAGDSALDGGDNDLPIGDPRQAGDDGAGGDTTAGDAAVSPGDSAADCVPACESPEPFCGPANTCVECLGAADCVERFPPGVDLRCEAGSCVPVACTLSGCGVNGACVAACETSSGCLADPDCSDPDIVEAVCVAAGGGWLTPWVADPELDPSCCGDDPTEHLRYRRLLDQDGGLTTFDEGSCCDNPDDCVRFDAANPDACQLEKSVEFSAFGVPSTSWVCDTSTWHQCGPANVCQPQGPGVTENWTCTQGVSSDYFWRLRGPGDVGAYARPSYLYQPTDWSSGHLWGPGTADDYGGCCSTAQSCAVTNPSSEVECLVADVQNVWGLELTVVCDGGWVYGCGSASVGAVTPSGRFECRVVAPAFTWAPVTPDENVDSCVARGGLFMPWFDWASEPGTTGDCCGAGAPGEYLARKVVQWGNGNTTDDELDRGCCNTSSDCVSNGACEPTGTLVDFAGEPGACDAGTWFGCDFTYNLCAARGNHRCVLSSDASLWRPRSENPRDGSAGHDYRLCPGANFASNASCVGFQLDYTRTGCCTASTDCLAVGSGTDCVPEGARDGALLCSNGGWYSCDQDSVGKTQGARVCTGGPTYAWQ